VTAAGAAPLAASARRVQAALDALGLGDCRVRELGVPARTAQEAADALGVPVGRADAAFVRETTGYSIGGIPPLGHATPLVLFVDASLARFQSVWAAGGTPHAVFPIAPAALSGLPGARTVDVG
jgi:prolyl-tRNA editing enzyme YbaK/EbsC (Cys-tRNA(Pro) deacylase)